MNKNFFMTRYYSVVSKIVETAHQTNNDSNPDHPECFCASKNVSKERGVEDNPKVFFVPLPIRYISSLFYKNSETLPAVAKWLWRAGRAIGTSLTFFLIVHIFFLPTFIHGESSALKNNTHDRAALMFTIAEDAIANEAYDKARAHLYEIASWEYDDIQTLFRLALNLIKIGEFQKSVSLLKRILNHEPNNMTVLYNIGYALKNDGHNNEAIFCYKKVLERNPNNDAAHLALGYAYLNKGDFTNGWPQHERYLKKSGKYAPELRALLAESTLAGKRILLTPEGGLGDTINFIQCAQLLRERGAYVIASVQKPLEKLLQRCDSVDEIISGVLTSLKYDARVTYMSLPAALYLDEITMPKRTPYLFADPKLVDFWQTVLNEKESTLLSTPSTSLHNFSDLNNPSIHPHLPSASSGTQGDREREYLIQKISKYKNPNIESKDQRENTLISHSSHNARALEEPTCHAITPKKPMRIGTCWQADLPHDESRLPVARRSIPLELITQLADIPGVTLYSLQTHEHNAACHAPTINNKIQTFDYPIDTEHGAFMDTAALITNMDLVISVDTATAHLAAALGKPTWLLLPYATDWRWIVGRTDSPWHPTMLIFKQPEPFDWQSVVTMVKHAFEKELCYSYRTSA